MICARVKAEAGQMSLANVVAVSAAANSVASSTEAVEVVAGLVARLIAPGAQWVDEWGVVAQMTARDVLVVAPYNAQVSRLAERLAATGVRAGTVDKFQGQQAPVVIYSMATSRPEDAPRGMEFPFEAECRGPRAAP